MFGSWFRTLAVMFVSDFGGCNFCSYGAHCKLKQEQRQKLHRWKDLLHFQLHYFSNPCQYINVITVSIFWGSDFCFDLTVTFTADCTKQQVPKSGSWCIWFHNAGVNLHQWIPLRSFNSLSGHSVCYASNHKMSNHKIWKDHSSPPFACVSGTEQ